MSGSGSGSGSGWGGSPGMSVPLLGKGSDSPSPSASSTASLSLGFIRIDFSQSKPDAGKLCRLILKGDVEGFRAYCTEFEAELGPTSSEKLLKSCLDTKIKDALDTFDGLIEADMHSYSSCSGATLYLAALILCNIYMGDSSYSGRFGICEEIIHRGLSNNTSCQYSVNIGSNVFEIKATPDSIARKHDDAKSAAEKSLLALLGATEVRDRDLARSEKAPLLRRRADSGSRSSLASLEVARYLCGTSPRGGKSTHPFSDTIGCGEPGAGAYLVCPTQQ